MKLQEVLAEVRWGVVWAGVGLAGLLATFLYGFACGLVAGWGWP